MLERMQQKIFKAFKALKNIAVSEIKNKNLGIIFFFKLPAHIYQLPFHTVRAGHNTLLHLISICWQS